MSHNQWKDNEVNRYTAQVEQLVGWQMEGNQSIKWFIQQFANSTNALEKSEIDVTPSQRGR